MGLAQLLKNYFPSTRRILVRNGEFFEEGDRNYDQSGDL